MLLINWVVALKVVIIGRGGDKAASFSFLLHSLCRCIVKVVLTLDIWLEKKFHCVDWNRWSLSFPALVRVCWQNLPVFRISALNAVVSVLADPKKREGHIPYRDSKLTRILQVTITYIIYNYFNFSWTWLLLFFCICLSDCKKISSDVVFSEFNCSCVTHLKGFSGLEIKKIIKSPFGD